MATIGKLVVSLAANSAKLKSDLKKSGKDVDSWAKSVSKKGKLVGAVFAAAGLSLAGFITAKTIATVNRYAIEIDKLAKSASKLDILPAALQKLRYQAALSGVGVEGLDKALEKMADSVGSAAAGSGEAMKALQELRIDAEKLKGLSIDQQFNVIAEAMKGVSAQADKVRLARDIFGRAGGDLVNTLSSDLKAVSAEFDALGLGITKNQARMVEAYNDAKHKLSTIFGGFGEQLTVALAGPFTEIVKWVTEVAQKMGGFGNVAKLVADGFIRAMAGIVDSVAGVVSAIGEARLSMKGMQAGWATTKGNFGAFLAQFGLESGKEMEAAAVARLRQLDQEGSKLVGSLNKVQATADGLTALADRLRKSLSMTQDDQKNSPALAANTLAESLNNTKDPLAQLKESATGAAGALKGVEDWQARISGADSLYNKLFGKEAQAKKPLVDNGFFNRSAQSAAERLSASRGSIEDVARMILRASKEADRGANTSINYDIAGMRDVVAALKAQAAEKFGADAFAKAFSEQISGVFTAKEGANSMEKIAAENAAFAARVAEMTGAVTRSTDGLTKASETAARLAASPPTTNFSITLTIDGKKKTFTGRAGDNIVDQIQLERAAASAE